jgi:hypothetical protein
VPYSAAMLNCLCVVALLVAAPLGARDIPAPPPPLTIARQTSLRCSAAFAMVAAGQAKGEADALAFPPLAKRGREYFVRVAARLMDETGFTREQLQVLMLREATAIRAEGPKSLTALMPPCLMLLDMELPQAAGPAQ